MNKKWLFVIGPVLIFIFFIIIRIWTNNIFIDAYPELKASILKVDYHNDFEMYNEFVLSNFSRFKIEKRFKFKDTIPSFSGRDLPDFIPLSNKYLYYLELKSYNSHGYRLFALEKDGSRLLILDEFGS